MCSCGVRRGLSAPCVKQQVRQEPFLRVQVLTCNSFPVTCWVPEGSTAAYRLSSDVVCRSCAAPSRLSPPITLGGRPAPPNPYPKVFPSQSPFEKSLRSPAPSGVAGRHCRPAAESPVEPWGATNRKTAFTYIHIHMHIPNSAAGNSSKVCYSEALRRALCDREAEGGKCWSWRLALARPSAHDLKCMYPRRNARRGRNW